MLERELTRKELLEPVLEAVEYYDGAATTGQIKVYLKKKYPNQDGYEFRWAQQDLANEGLLERPPKRGGEWRLV